ncbi:MAG: hypothetical protein ACYDB3_06185, partial [Acidimicrobiales bacterium]
GGFAYVFGMVAPLFALAVVWDRRGWGENRPLSARGVTLRLLRRRWTVPLSSFAGGILLVAMGVLVAILAVNGPNMATRGWQVTLASRLQHAAHVATVWTGRLPGWVTASILLGVLAVLASFAVRQTADRNVDQARFVGDDAPDDTDHHGPMPDGGVSVPSNFELEPASAPEPVAQKGK